MDKDIPMEDILVIGGKMQRNPVLEIKDDECNTNVLSRRFVSKK